MSNKINPLEELEKTMKEMSSDPKAKEAFAESLAIHCYNLLEEDEKEIYDRATKLFGKSDCVGHVLSVLTMGYLNIPGITKEKMIELHSTLYVPFIMVEPLHWVMDELMKLKEKRERNGGLKI